LALVADMDDQIDVRHSDDRPVFGWGLGASVVLHALAALVLTGVITGHVTPPLQDTVEVELVPPPQEEPAPAPEVPEIAPPEEQQEEVPPEEPAEEQPEQAQQAPPPPPPPPAPEQQAAEAGAEVPVLQPVEKFGEEDRGPQETAEDPPLEEAEPEEEPAEQLEDEAEPAENQAEATGTDVAPEDAAEDTEPVVDPAETVEAGTEASETEEPVTDEETETASGTEAESDVGIAEEPSAEEFGIVGPIVTDATPSVKPAPPARAARQQAPAGGSGTPPGMLAAREFYSRVLLDDPEARTAMRGMTEGQRLNHLCMTELRAQIASVSALPPELLPRFRPPPGNVLQPRGAAFRSLGRWFDVSFRCETDGEITRVEKFAFKIGNEIPQSQWLERGLTGF